MPLKTKIWTVSKLKINHPLLLKSSSLYPLIRPSHHLQVNVHILLITITHYHCMTITSLISQSLPMLEFHVQSKCHFWSVDSFTIATLNYIIKYLDSLFYLFVCPAVLFVTCWQTHMQWINLLLGFFDGLQVVLHPDVLQKGQSKVFVWWHCLNFKYLFCF